MLPASLWQMLWRVIFPRRHVTPAHDGKVTPVRMDEARSARLDAEAKLADTDSVVQHARGVLWRLHQQREHDGGDDRQREPNHRD